jgi:hypothetical protein
VNRFIAPSNGFIASSKKERESEEVKFTGKSIWVKSGKWSEG